MAGGGLIWLWQGETTPAPVVTYDGPWIDQRHQLQPHKKPEKGRKKRKSLYLFPEDIRRDPVFEDGLIDEEVLMMILLDDL